MIQPAAGVYGGTFLQGVLLVSLGLDAGFPAADGHDSVDESLIFPTFFPAFVRCFLVIAFYISRIA
jgi:hypothetical protein